MQGIWALYIVVLVGYGLGTGLLSFYTIGQLVVYVRQHRAPLVCKDINYEVVEANAASNITSACYVLTEVWSCEDESKVTSGGLCWKEYGEAVKPVQLSPDDVTREYSFTDYRAEHPNKDCSICYEGQAADNMFYRRIGVEPLLGDSCPELHTPAQAERACAAESLLDESHAATNSTQYKCWLGVEGNTDHGHLLVREAERTDFPTVGVIVTACLLAFYVMYLLKKLREARKLWNDVDEEAAGKREDAVHQVQSATIERGLSIRTPMAPFFAGSDDDDADKQLQTKPASFEFAEVEYVAMEAEQTCTVQVVRRSGTEGTGDGTALLPVIRVPWSTSNVNMSKGSYVESSGNVLFRADERAKLIEIPFQQDDDWSNVAMMKVALGKPELLRTDSVGESRYSEEPAVARLGFHNVARIAVLNDDRFPNNLANTVSLGESVRAFFSHTWRVKEAAFMKCVYYRMGTPFCYLVQKLIELRLFNCTLDTTCTADFPLYGTWTRKRELLALAFAYVFNFLLGWYLDTWHELWAPVNSVRTMNRKAVFTKMLYVEPHIAQEMTIGQIHTMMQRACEDAVYHAWYTFSMALGTASKIVVQLGFLIYIGSYEESHAILLVIPLVIAIDFPLYYFRIPHLMKLEKKYMEEEGKRIDFTNTHLMSRDVVLRYRQVEDASSTFDSIHTAEMWARFQFLLYGFNTAYIGGLVPVMVYATMLYIAGTEALDEESEIRLGDVVLVLSTITSFSSSINGLGRRLSRVGRGFLGIQILAEFLNKDTIISEHKRQREAAARAEAEVEEDTVPELHEDVLQKHHVVEWHLTEREPDQREIVVQNACFKPRSHVASDEADSEGLYRFTLTIAQGTFTIIDGPEACGKSSLLKLIEGEYIPDTGLVVVPQHLTCRLVTTKENNVVPGTIKENLIWGVTGGRQHPASADKTWTLKQLQDACYFNGWGQDRGSTVAELLGSPELKWLMISGTEPYTRGAHLAKTKLVHEVCRLGTAKIAAVGRRFGLHRNGAPTMAAMLEQPIGTLATSQTILVALVRAIVAETDVLLLDGVLDTMQGPTFVTVLEGLQGWQAERGESGNAKTIIASVRNEHTGPAVHNALADVHMVSIADIAHKARHAPPKDEANAPLVPPVL